MTTVTAELRQVLAELELLSHVSAMNLAPSGRDAGEDIGGRRPPGGIDRKGDREPDYPLKSSEHFRRRLLRARTDGQLEQILDDARTALAAARRLPDWRHGEAEPERGTLRWKRMIADSHERAEVLARRHEVGVRTVRRYRALYGENVAA